MKLAMTQFVVLVLFTLIAGVGVDFLVRPLGPRVHTAYRGFVAFIWRQSARAVRWAWRNHARFIVGFATGFLVALYLTGYF